MKLVTTLLLLVVAVVSVWLVSAALGYQMSLTMSLVLSIGFTLLLNLMMSAFRRKT